MDATEYAFLSECMEVAKAKDRMKNLSSFVYPHASKESKAAIHKKMTSEATLKVELEAQAVKVSDLSGVGMSIDEILKAKNGNRK